MGSADRVRRVRRRDAGNCAGCAGCGCASARRRIAGAADHTPGGGGKGAARAGRAVDICPTLTKQPAGIGQRLPLPTGEECFHDGAEHGRKTPAQRRLGSRSFPGLSGTGRYGGTGCRRCRAARCRRRSKRRAPQKFAAADICKGWMYIRLSFL